MNNFCRMCGEQIGGGILYCLVCAPKAAAHIEIESLQADNAALRQRVKELEGENERLRDAGWHLYHCLSDYGELSDPASDIFMPSQEFKEAVLESWKLVVKTLKGGKP
jgi:hypothetical protein